MSNTIQSLVAEEICNGLLFLGAKTIWNNSQWINNIFNAWANLIELPEIWKEYIREKKSFGKSLESLVKWKLQGEDLHQSIW